MQATLYTMSVPLFVRSLTQMSIFLDKAAAFAEQRKVDPAVLLGMRLAVDMFPLTRQFQLASDFAKGGTARLAGIDVPKWPDEESSIAELKARLDKTVAFVQGVDRAPIEGAAEREIVLNMRGREVRFAGFAYLSQHVLPNFYFHATTAYAILRHAGVELGKRDFIGPLD